MRTVTALAILLALFASLGPLAQPLQSALPLPGRSDCCAKMKMNEPQNDCSKEAPKSKQDRQCCATCVIGLDLFIASATPLATTQPGDESFPLYHLQERSRSERPPTPPPRPSVA
jgi:hypothetical protein